MANIVILQGNLGQDIEVVNFDGGARKAKISIATSYGYKDKQGVWQNGTDWHSIELWNPSEYVIANGFKGTKVFVQGSAKTNKYEDANGVTKYHSFVLASVFNIISPAGQSSAANNGGNTSHEEAPGMSGGFVGSNTTSTTGNFDDLPF